MNNNVDFDKYSHFVDAVTSDCSKDFVSLADRLGELEREGSNIERLTTAGVGLLLSLVSFWKSLKRWYFRESLGTTITESILLLSWVTLCGMWHKLVWLWTYLLTMLSEVMSESWRSVIQVVHSQ
jgi:hypothetical protein